MLRAPALPIAKPALAASLLFLLLADPAGIRAVQWYGVALSRFSGLVAAHARARAHGVATDTVHAIPAVALVAAGARLAERLAPGRRPRRTGDVVRRPGPWLGRWLRSRGPADQGGHRSAAVEHGLGRLHAAAR